MKIFKYLGGGHIPFIPAADLDDRAIKVLAKARNITPTQLKNQLEGSGLYQEVEATEDEDPAEDPNTDDQDDQED